MRIPLAGILMVLLPVSAAYAKGGNKPDLKLSAMVENIDAERQPVLVIHIVNQSGHALRIPEPPLLCKTAPGALSLDVKFIPEDNSTPPAPADCGLEVDGSGLPDIRERAKNWLVLKSGQDYEARRPLTMGLSVTATGSYELRVIYQSPVATAEDQQKLQQAGIVAPSGRFESEKFVYKVSTLKH